MELSEAVEKIDGKMKEYKESFENKYEDLEAKIKTLQAKGGHSGGGVISNKGLRNTIQNGIIRGLAERKDQIARSEGGAMMEAYEIKTVAAMSSANLTV